MPAPRRVPDAFYHALFWLGSGLAIILFGTGFAARAGDASPWPFWIAAPAPLLPFAFLVWLRDSGKAEFVDTEEVEERLYWDPLQRRFRNMPRRWALALFILTTIAGIVWDWYLEDRAYNHVLYATENLDHPEHVAWAMIAVGICGAVYETVRVVRNARPAPEEPTPPGTEGPPEA